MEKITFVAVRRLSEIVLDYLDLNVRKNFQTKYCLALGQDCSRVFGVAHFYRRRRKGSFMCTCISLNGHCLISFLGPICKA